MTIPQHFPVIKARNLLGENVSLPSNFRGRRNVVMVAFNRNHQQFIDSWVPWLERESLADAELALYEIPAISQLWSPMRPFIDGGMATAIKTPAILQRTMTIYGDLKRFTRRLGIVDRSTISIFAVGVDGEIYWSGRGAFSERAANELHTALGQMK